MIPVKQSKLYAPDGIHNGNCLAAVLASMLELPLWMVPPFEDMFARHDWDERVVEWLRRMFGLRQRRIDGHPSEGLPEFYMAIGPAARGVHHIVIYSGGKMVHDPHPSDAGLVRVEFCRVLEPVAGGGH